MSQINVNSDYLIDGSIESLSFIKTGGTSSQFLKADGSIDSNNYALSSDLLNYVPTTRTITINGVTQNLSVNRTWSVGTLTGSGTNNYISKWNSSTSQTNSRIFDNGTNVGIGTASPGHFLHLSKDSQLSLVLERTGSFPSFVALRNESASLKIETNAFNGISFLTGTSTPIERFRLNSSGNFGIGTTAPLTRFHNVLSSAGTIAWTATSGTSAIFESGVSNRNFVNIVAPSTGQSELWFGNQTNEVRGRVRYNHSNDSLALWTSATERLTITSSGNVGIGTLAPTEKLEVNGNVLSNNYKRIGDIAETNFTYDYTNVDNSTDVIPIFAVSNNRLIVKEGSFTSLNTGDIKIGTLPSGARPDATRYVFGYSSTRGSIVFQILTNGDVVLLGSSTTGTNYLDFEITLDTSIITTE